VDDEPDVADLFRQRFRRESRQGTYVMHFAASGAEALDRLAGEIQLRLAAVLSDINIPGMDGLQLLGEIKQVSSPRFAGHDGDRLWRRRAKTPCHGTWRFRIHHQASRFRSVKMQLRQLPTAAD
jgi:CheY-like chemotaxis protein